MKLPSKAESIALHGDNVKIVDSSGDVFQWPVPAGSTIESDGKSDIKGAEVRAAEALPGGGWLFRTSAGNFKVFAPHLDP